MRLRFGAVLSRSGSRAALAAAALAFTVQTAVANTTGQFFSFGDYRQLSQPAIDALARGDLAGFAHAGTMMGPFSVLLRAPTVLVARGLGGGDRLGYTLGSLACALPLAALAVWLVVEAGRLRRPLYARVTVVGLFALCPFIPAAFQWGHPEDLLAIALCVAAVLFAFRGHAVWGAVALGLAIATKQWALVAIAPALVAMPRHRLRVVAIGSTLLALVVGPLAVVDPHAFVDSVKSIAGVQSWVSAMNVWWPLAHAHHFRVFDGVAYVHAIKYTLPSWLNLIPHALIVLLGLPLGALIAARRRPVTLDQALSMLALLMLLRCALDPWDNAYYQVAPLVALYTRDALCARGLPLASMFATVAAAITFNHIAISHGGLGGFVFSNTAGVAYWAYLAITLPVAGWLVLNTLEWRVPAALTASLRVPGLGRAATAAPPAQAA